MILILNEKERRSIVSLNASVIEAIETGFSELAKGNAPGRTDEHQTTVCDLTGVGVQDTVIVIKTLSAAAEQNMGLIIS